MPVPEELKLGEAAIIEALASLGCAEPPAGVTGMGDDCAVIPAGDRSTLITADLLVEGVHFRREWTSARDLGHKALAVNLSDVAAMGGSPQSAFLSLALPADLETAWLEAFSSGLDALACATGTVLLGGDTTRSPGPVVINIALLGHAPSERIKYRHTAEPGDLICVTGTLGDAAAALRLLEQGLTSEPSGDEANLLTALHRPIPNLERGSLLAALDGVHAMMDLSDGLATDLSRMLAASACGARIELEDLPLSAALLRVSEAHGWDACELAAAGGEDYCLLFTTDRDAELMEAAVIGEVVEGKGVSWLRGGAPVELPGHGFSHFQG